MDAKHEQSPEYARIGSTLENRYRILDVLAQGGMGVVYRGERLGLNRTVAVKFLHASFAANAQARERFERELQAMSRLTHPNCVSVIDYGIADSPFIVMEYVTGRTLKDVLAENGPLQPVRALYIASQILAALAHAHSQDMVHRDIKPANIILADVEGTLDHVYVLDFGLAKFMSGAAKDDLTASWMVLGTPAYMSPEQGRGESIGAATDIYSTGVVLFELLTGTKPYNADNPIDTIHQHQFAPLPSIRDRLPEADFSAELDEAILTALAKDPGQRFASAQIFAEALDFVPEAAPTRTSTRLRALTAPPGRGRAESTQLGSSEAVSQAALATSLLGGAPTPAKSARPGAAKPTSTGGTVSLSNSDIQVVSSAAIVIASPAPHIAPTAARTAAAAPSDASIEPAASAPPAKAAAPAKARTRGGTRWLVLASMFLTVAGMVTWYATRNEVLQPADTTVPRPGDELTGTPSSTEPAPTRTNRDERAARGAQTTARKPTLPGQDQRATPSPSAAELARNQQPAQNTATSNGQAAAAAATEQAPTTAQPPKPTEPAVETAPVVDSIADVERLIQQGRREDAIQGILRLRRSTFPRSGYLAYLLGNLYFDKTYWDDGLDAYIDAVKFTPQYRSNANVNENAIRALSHDQARHKASALFTEYIRRSGLKYLRKAAASDKNPKVRQRAKALMSRISRGRR
jgi:serine/threonine protein kinase